MVAFAAVRVVAALSRLGSGGGGVGVEEREVEGRQAAPSPKSPADKQAWLLAAAASAPSTPPPTCRH